MARNQPSETILLSAAVAEQIAAAGGKVDYVEVRDADNLEPVSDATTCALIAVAAFFGTTRLIDNVLIEILSIG